MRSLLPKLFALVEIFLALTVASAQACEKKGIAFASAPFAKPADLLRMMNAHWYYNWTLQPLRDSGGVPFVPMVNGSRDRLQGDLRFVADHGTVPLLLGFNEPDLTGTAQMTVDEAAVLWPRLMRGALELGSPAASSRHPDWLDHFMDRASRNGLKIDFIAFHYYGPPDARAFLKRVDDLHARYGRPIWITEFAVLNPQWRTTPDLYSPRDALNFMRTALQGLEGRTYVERFAWWGFGKANAEAVHASSFFRSDGGLTDLGRYYAGFEANETGKLCGAPD